MRPRNDREREVDRLAGSLPPVSPAQHRWVVDKVIGWHINRSGRRGWCERCGHSFEVSPDTGGRMACPGCGRELETRESRRRTMRGSCYVQIIASHKGWQVIRYLLVRYESHVGEEMRVGYQEVLQQWCQPGRPTVTRGVGLVFMPYYSRVPYSQWGVLSIKTPAYFYTEWMECEVYPRMRLFKPYREPWRKAAKNGFCTPSEAISIYLSIPYFETLFKAGKTAKLRDASKHYTMFWKYWPSVRVALRHGFVPEHWSDYFEYLRMLSYLRKDMHSPRYVAPPDYADIHYRVVEQYRRKIEEVEARKRERAAIREAEEAERQKERDARAVRSFGERIERFRGLLIAGGGIEIRPLMTVQEFADEGKAMRHCVFALGYYKRPDSLILSARDGDGRRIETVEVNIPRGVVVQSRGVCNSTTERHDDILAMVNARMGDIQRMAGGRIAKR